MKFGLMFANVGPFATPVGAEAVGKAAEAAQFDSIWTVEHVLIPVGYESEYPYDKSGKMPGATDADLPDPLIWLAFVAAHTNTVKLATGILIVPQRNPGVLAKEVATLDVLSGGRMILGVGAGWLEEEFDALGIPFAERGRRLDDHIGAMRALWQNEEASFDGPFTNYANVVSRPAPIHGTVPIVVGGHSEAAARRAGRLGDGFFPGKGSPTKLAELLSVMRQAADDAGRDPELIEVTASSPAIFAPDPRPGLEELAALGVSRVIVPPLSFDPTAIGDALGAFGERVVGPLADL